MRIGVDLDDVCVDFIGTLIGRYNYRYGANDGHVDVRREDVVTWDLLDVFTRFETRDDLWGWVGRDCLTNWAQAGAVPGALDGLQSLALGGHDIVIITSKAQGWEWVAHTWLGSHRVPAREVHITADKAAVPACDVYLDDRPKNLREIKAAHPDAIVVKFDRPHNRNEPVKGTYLATSWDEFLEIVEEGGTPRLQELMDRPTVFSDETEVRVTSVTGGQKGQKLARLGSLDPRALKELAKVSGFGAEKYAAFNFLKGYEWSLSFDALERHLLEFWDGEDTDEESGRLHIAHAAWHCLALTSFTLRGLGTDDRPPV